MVTACQNATDTRPPLEESVRKCLVCGVVKPKDELIRFVLDPDHNVVPDLAARLPGRGMWVSASREAVKTATQKNLFAKSAKASAKVSPALLEQVETLFAKRCLELLGLAKGAGLAVMGQPQVEQANKEGALSYILTARDAGQDGLKKLFHARQVPSGFTKTQLGEALGREQLASIGLKPHVLTEKLENELTRWQGVALENVPKTNKCDSETT